MTKKGGPVEFSERIALRVCGLISEGLSLRKIQAVEGMPSKAGILEWLLEDEAHKANGEPTHPKALFVDHYARAREVQADCLADDIISIADDSQYDTALDEQGKTVVNMEHIQRDRLRVDPSKTKGGSNGCVSESPAEPRRPEPPKLLFKITPQDVQCRLRAGARGRRRYQSSAPPRHDRQPALP